MVPPHPPRRAARRPVLFVALLVILFGAELFTNGIEWLGRELGLAEGAVGSVLAAVGTALPETLIPIIAIIFGSAEGSHEVGVGAILGAPFMLSTLAMFVTGVGALASVPAARRGPRWRSTPASWPTTCALLHRAMGSRSGRPSCRRT